jgi:hypothetical protein
MLTLEQRIFIVKCYGLGNVSYDYVSNTVNEKFGMRVSNTAVRKLIRKFDQTGSVLTSIKKKTILNEDNAATIVALDSVGESPQMSLRNRSNVLQISKSHLQRIFRENKVRPYKPKFLHTLREGDESKRLLFCLEMGERILENRNYVKNLIFSDECTFSTNGIVSSQNCRFWSHENPHFVINTNSQYYKKVNVWCAITYDKIIGPYFFEANLNQNTYLEMLENYFWNELENFNLEYRQHCTFQHDGCPSHATRRVCEWITNKFGQNWIGRNGPTIWPPRSPDLTPCDFYLWGRLKNKVYSQNLGDDLENLKTSIRNAINEIQVEELHKVYSEFSRRMNLCCDMDGGLIEQ